MADDTPAQTAADSTPARREGDQWPDRAADLLESTIGTVRTRGLRPLGKIAQLVVFALILLAAGLALLLLLLIALARVIIVYLPVQPHARAVWITYAGLGAIFVLAGAFFMRKRH